MEVNTMRIATSDRIYWVNECCTKEGEEWIEEINKWVPLEDAQKLEVALQDHIKAFNNLVESKRKLETENEDIKLKLERAERKLDVYTDNLAFQIVNMINKNIELKLKFVEINKLINAMMASRDISLVSAKRLREELNK
jgi:hypothetical protein